MIKHNSGKNLNNHRTQMKICLTEKKNFLGVGELRKMRLMSNFGHHSIIEALTAARVLFFKHVDVSGF